MVKNDHPMNSNAASEPGPKSSRLEELLTAVLDQPDKWLVTPNHQFGGRQPRELVGTVEETKILDLLHAVDQGLF